MSDDIPQELTELELRFEALHSAHRDLLNQVNDAQERVARFEARLAVIERYFKVVTNA